MGKLLTRTLNTIRKFNGLLSTQFGSPVVAAQHWNFHRETSYTTYPFNSLNLKHNVSDTTKHHCTLSTSMVFDALSKGSSRPLKATALMEKEYDDQQSNEERHGATSPLSSEQHYSLSNLRNETIQTQAFNKAWNNGNHFKSTLSQPNSSENIQRILDSFIKQFNVSGIQPFKNVLLVSVQHLLGTTYDMLTVMHHHGLTDAVIAGKIYSTHQPTADKIAQHLNYTVIADPKYQLMYGRFESEMLTVVKQVWAESMKKIQAKHYDMILILDDGADLLKETPPELFEMDNKPRVVFGVEQTRNGSNDIMFNAFPFNVVHAAGSLAKTRLEYPWVAAKIIEKVMVTVTASEKILGRKPDIGIVGYGCMGRQIAQQLSQLNYHIYVSDNNAKVFQDLNHTENSYQLVPNNAVLMSFSDIIIGTTGTDITDDIAERSALLQGRRHKWLISASSKDIEFKTLLMSYQHHCKKYGKVPKPLDDITVQLKESTVTILRGGMPINFDNSEHSVAPTQIWPTRAALMLACLHAVNTFHCSKKVPIRADVLMLPGKMQFAIIKNYMKLNPKDRFIHDLTHIPSTQLYQTITEQSEGTELIPELHINYDTPIDSEASDDDLPDEYEKNSARDPLTLEYR